MRSLKLLTVLGSIVLIVGLSGVASGTTKASSKEPTVKITAPPLMRGGYNQAKYATIKATHFPPDTQVSFLECAVPTQSDPNRCSNSSGSEGFGTTNARGEIKFSRMVLLGGGYFSDPDSDSCGAEGATSPCYATVDIASGQDDVGASKAYYSYCNHFQGFRCFPKARR